jgi:hypothetical protein
MTIKIINKIMNNPFVDKYKKCFTPNNIIKFEKTKYFDMEKGYYKCVTGFGTITNSENSNESGNLKEITNNTPKFNIFHYPRFK